MRPEPKVFERSQTQDAPLLLRRVSISITGLVQGIGYRPHIYATAQRLRLNGFVRNRSSSVEIEAQGTHFNICAFLEELREMPPRLARINSVTVLELELQETFGFQIHHSMPSRAAAVSLSPDLATCTACLSELFNREDRRFAYPFLNCTECGPRFTIVEGVPYDRTQTTMKTFPLCSACRAEYEDPANRRFHAQPTACAACGPRLSTSNGADDPIQAAMKRIRAGDVVAIKGIGGYHLACDATNPAAVAKLRVRKNRPAKPFAVMVENLAAAHVLAIVNEFEASELVSPAAPIVLLRRRPDSSVSAGVAPGPWVGIFLPFTPLHHLLLRSACGVPLVMTSANLSDEAILHRVEDEVRLGALADLVISHDRTIHLRCDDSVLRVVDSERIFVRRSRGYVPTPLPLPRTVPGPILAVGGEQKNTFTLAEGDLALVSHHVGDLGSVSNEEAFRAEVRRWEEIYQLKPLYLACDLHPDYRSTQYARERSARESLPLIQVQHHHAHMAACMAENGLNGETIGVTFDGSGFGPDGTVWGGEILLGTYEKVRRIAHLKTVPMPGAAKAVREPWRMLAAHLLAAGVDPGDHLSQLPAYTGVRRMIERGLNSPLTSSVGRLFDAAASLIASRDEVSFEGQAALELEALAEGVKDTVYYPFAWAEMPNSPFTFDPGPLWRNLIADRATGVNPAILAHRFHLSLAHAVLEGCRAARGQSSVRRVALSGGVFANVRLLRQCLSLLTEDGFEVYVHRKVPPGDGGLSYGQAAVASALLARTERNVPFDSGKIAIP